MYITDELKCISDSIAGLFGGKSMSRRFADILDEMSGKQLDETRTADEIISSISDKLERLNNESI